jgi:hypothetical protein
MIAWRKAQVAWKFAWMCLWAYLEVGLWDFSNFPQVMKKWLCDFLSFSIFV